MRHFQSSLSVRIVVVLIALTMTMLGSSSISAQRRRPVPSNPPKAPSTDTPSNDVNLRTAEQAQTEMSILMSRRTVMGDLEKERNRRAAQLTSDLELLERVNKESLAPLLSATTLDFKEVAQVSSDVKARAIRIKFYSPIILVDRTGEKIRYESNENQITPRLAQLSQAITKFVNNPVFRVSAPNDGELRSVAAHELDGIIKLSDTINKLAKKLSKSLVARK
jgi:hypothetical protein